VTTIGRDVSFSLNGQGLRRRTSGSLRGFSFGASRWGAAALVFAARLGLPRLLLALNLPRRLATWLDCWLLAPRFDCLGCSAAANLSRLFAACSTAGVARAAVRSAACARAAGPAAGSRTTRGHDAHRGQDGAHPGTRAPGAPRHDRDIRDRRSAGQRWSARDHRAAAIAAIEPRREQPRQVEPRANSRQVSRGRTARQSNRGASSPGRSSHVASREQVEPRQDSRAGRAAPRTTKAGCAPARAPKEKPQRT